MAETTAWRSHCQFITFITFLFTVNVIRQMATLFSKVDSNKLWHDVQHEENVICAHSLGRQSSYHQMDLCELSLLVKDKQSH